MDIQVKVGDVLDEQADVLICTANPWLNMSGGVNVHLISGQPQDRPAGIRGDEAASRSPGDRRTGLLFARGRRNPLHGQQSVRRTEVNGHFPSFGQVHSVLCVVG